MMNSKTSDQVFALIVNQWLDEWNQVAFSVIGNRQKPEPHFYTFSLPASTLLNLSGIYRRKKENTGERDLGIQRAHTPERSDEIRRFVHGGFPWSTLSDNQQRLDEFKDLRMPGWLPTSILVNILAPDTVRRGKKIKDEHVIKIDRVDNNLAKLSLPNGIKDAEKSFVPPIEIIDGQHRLLAFDEKEFHNENYELPIVAFYNLDITWQAYLFYMINIKPKRINASLAFDLYPLLRVQEWLEKSPEGPAIYRETRAQLLTEILWSHPESPWKDRISMLGDRKGGSVTQSAFIRSLISSYVKRWDGRGTSIGGLFGAELSNDASDILQWQYAQQAAFLIFVWKRLASSVKNCSEAWAENIRSIETPQTLPLFGSEETNSAFVSKFSLLSTDQGVRGVLQVTNDMCYVVAKEIHLDEWEWNNWKNIENDVVSNDDVTFALQELEILPIAKFVENIANELAKFDWRTSSYPFTNDEARLKQAVYRGSGGYKEIRLQLIRLLSNSKDNLVSKTAKSVEKILGY